MGNEEQGKGKWEEGRRKENWDWKMEQEFFFLRSAAKK